MWIKIYGVQPLLSLLAVVEMNPGVWYNGLSM